MSETKKAHMFDLNPLVTEVEEVIKKGLNKILINYMDRYQLLENTHKQIMRLPSIRQELHKNPYESNSDLDYDTDETEHYTDTKNRFSSTLESLEYRLSILEKKNDTMIPVLDKILNKIIGLDEDVKSLKFCEKIAKNIEKENIKIHFEESKEELNEDEFDDSDTEDVNPLLITCSAIALNKNSEKVEEDNVKSDVEGKSEAIVEGKSEVVVEANVEGETEADVEVDVEANVEADVEANVEGETEADVEADVEAIVEGETEADVEAIVEGETEADVEADVEANVEGETEADVEANVEGETEADVEAYVEANVEGETEADVEGDSEADVESESEADVESRVEEEVASIETETKVEEEDNEDQEEDQDEDQEEEFEEATKTEVEDKKPSSIEEEDDEELFEIEIDDKTYCTNDDQNGFIWELTEDGEQGEKIGYLKDGDAYFYEDEN